MHRGRTLVVVVVVVVVVVLVCGIVAASGCESCGTAPLSRVDAGTLDPEDAGALPDAGEIFDAGFVDAGFVDAGPPADAGPVCDFPPLATVAFACEGDEDFCDLSENQFGFPGSNIVAIWSHRDADDLVMQIRYQANPFRDVVGWLTIGFSEAGGAVDAEHGICQASDAPGDDVCTPASIAINLQRDVQSRDPKNAAYPPQLFDDIALPSGAPDTTALDMCASRISMATPLLELRIPSALVARVDGTYAYAATDQEGTTWPPDQPALLTSQGGSVDDLPTDLVRLCDVMCTGGAE